MSRNEGYTIVMLLVAASVLAIGILAAVPVWQTQIQRENEDELIFRGNQYVEAIRRYQTKNPGQFPRTMDELFKKRYLRRLYPDPMTKDGQWDVLVQQTRMRRGPLPTAPSQSGNMQLLAVPQADLSSVSNVGIVGVVSTSGKTSIRTYNEETTYDKWLFYYGQDGKVKAEVAYYGRPDKK
jgi:type II secretory pathway pseudopilin PulG